MLNSHKNALYVAVGEHIASCHDEVPRSKLNERFPDVEPKRLSKALENACARKLIHVTQRNVYRGGPKPVGSCIARKTNLSDDDVLPLDTEVIIQEAMKSRLPLEFAWMGMISGPSSSMAFR